MSNASLHHVAYVCRDPEETRHFYEDLMGFPLVHTELAPVEDGFMRHFFFQLDDGSAIAFFDIHDAGEKEGWTTNITEGTGVPLWSNHLALRATSEKQAEVRARFEADGSKPLMVLDHDWCISDYYVDPNGLLIELCRDNPEMPAVGRAEARRLLSAVPAQGTPKATDRALEFNG
ncbi:MAG: VOC family protein [Microthrixaceae bacterium]